MFEHHPHLIAVRGFMVATCLSLLAACNGGDDTSSSSSSPSAAATSSSSSSVSSSSSTSSSSSSSSSVSSSSSSSTSSSSNSSVSVPAAPTGVNATAGNTQVSLTWTASSGATGYHVKRATTSNGTYTQLSAAPTSNSYTDTGLVNGTAYFYMISAFNSAGDGANSTPASATPAAPNPPPTTLGTWINVTPAGVNLSNVDLGSPQCNYGARTVQADPVVHSNLYTMFDCQGVWKSTDYGATWTGPINTGTNGGSINGCSGGITISRSNSASAATLYAGCIRGAGVGFWKSVDGGVNWTKYVVGVVPFREDYYPPVVDPYDDQHLLMYSHEFDAITIVESTNGGQNWHAVTLASGMQGGFRSPAIFFVNTGNATTTRGTWLWIGDFGSGYGTWRTANSGTSWSKVDNTDYIGAAQLYQPDNNGVVFMAGSNGGVVRSTDYGQTWTHVGLGNLESIVFGTSKNVYTMYGYPVGPGGTAYPQFQVAAQPGTGTWVAPGGEPMAQGPAQAAVVNNGTNNILVGAMWNSGLWRYVEP